uniref:Uncharacterized protein n=1 Tax=Oryza sativa subsp. japonica TaxID=39947 RepID=Q2QUK4_ORYSJ|nr:hypothetical protein LOC_Os12g15960 [Oryza sativa Japonica Group]
MGCELHRNTRESAHNTEEWIEEDHKRSQAKGQARGGQPSNCCVSHSMFEVKCYNGISVRLRILVTIYIPGPFLVPLLGCMPGSMEEKSIRNIVPIQSMNTTSEAPAIFPYPLQESVIHALAAREATALHRHAATSQYVTRCNHQTIA